ncbi:hypothetical protein B0H17DRAFT_1076368 [Mycena rosella]|uniref:Uncharacterized protein n=1 Tax=Mycena rosella TaxID=1033263 RepID=A0AAD7D6M2_MYCRO|nr:hypothetical protein B0H17DRAFT_1076368 [Mycena rosella]
MLRTRQSLLATALQRVRGWLCPRSPGPLLTIMSVAQKELQCLGFRIFVATPQAIQSELIGSKFHRVLDSLNRWLPNPGLRQVSPIPAARVKLSTDFR